MNEQNQNFNVKNMKFWNHKLAKFIENHHCIDRYTFYTTLKIVKPNLF